MRWYKFFSKNNLLSLKYGDRVYVLDEDKKNIKEYGVILGPPQGDWVYGVWASNPKEALSKWNNFSEDKDMAEKRDVRYTAFGRLPLDFLMDVVADEKLLQSLGDYSFIAKQVENLSLKHPEVKAQALYNLDIPIPDSLDGINSERLWLYELNAPNLWWGEGKYKGDEGKRDVIQGLPRYNPEYHDDAVGAYFTWWEPYIEPVMYEDLINVQRSMNAYYNYNM